MKIITQPLYEIIAYSMQTRDAAHQKPSDKQHTPDGGPLYWLPIHALDAETDREIEIIAFSTVPVPVRALDLLQLDGAHLMNVYGGRNGSQPVGMYYFDRVNVVGNMLDAIRESDSPDTDEEADDVR